MTPVAPPSPEQVATDQRPTWTRYAVLAALCLGATIAYIHRNSMGACEVVIRRDLQLTPQQTGLMMSAFFVTYAIFQLPTGWWGHRLGTRRGLTLFVSLWSGATATIALASGLPTLVGSRLAMGAAQSGLFPCCTQTVALWFPTTQRGFPTGALGAFQSVGGALGLWLTGWLVGSLFWSWRAVYGFYAIPGLLGAVAFYYWFRDKPEDHGGVNEAELRLIRGTELELDETKEVAAVAVEPTVPEPVVIEPTPWRGMLTSGAMWAICGQQVFRAAGYIFFGTWFTTYLYEERGLDLTRSTFLAGLPLWGVVVGQLFGGWLSDVILRRTGRLELARKWLAVWSMMGCALAVVWATTAPSAMLCVAALVLAAFVGAIGAPCSYAITIDMGGRHIPMVFSLMNMAGNIGAIGFPLAVPYMLKLFGSWDAALGLFGAMYVGAAFCWLVLDPRGTVYERRSLPPLR